jgi:Fe-S-cluster containining protein
MTDKANSEHRTSHLEALRARVDVFFVRVKDAHPGQMQCRRGCSACCQRDLRILPVEWEPLAAAVLALAPEDHVAIRAAIDAGPRRGDQCVLLADDGSCRAFDARPLVCRSHGLPVRLGAERTSCQLNFLGTLSSLPDADVLDQTQLSVTLGLIDRLTTPSPATAALARDPDGRLSLDAALGALLD